MKDNESASPEGLNAAALALTPPELGGDLRRIIEHINLELPGEPSRTIVVTGVQEGDGASRIACWLSASLAQAKVGDVLYLNASPASLLDAHGGGDAAPAGLLGLVREPDRCEAIYQKTAVANLLTMRAWTNPNADMLHITDQQIAQALATFRTRFAYVVIDAPAPLASPLTIMLARHSGGTLVVVAANKTDCELVAETGAALARSGTRIIGAVLNEGRMR
jgi:Mrp family chromosome partitioning ATPase